MPDAGKLSRRKARDVVKHEAIARFRWAFARVKYMRYPSSHLGTLKL